MTLIVSYRQTDDNKTKKIWGAYSDVVGIIGPDFERSVNFILKMRADYAHHITICAPIHGH